MPASNVLVTGGAGFIGSHLIDRLIVDDHIVTCVDNLCSGQEKNIKHLLEHSRFSFLELDLNEPSTFDQITGQYDVIFHLASQASPVFYEKYAVETLLVNSVATVRLLKLAARHKSRFLFASTSEMYGDPLEHPQHEKYYGNVNPVGPKAHYKESKRFGEAAVVTYVREKDVDGRIVRIFNTYGPRNRADDGRVIPNFINQALRNKPLTVYGDGAQTRSYCYVSDLVEGLMKVVATNNLSGEVFNLGNPDEYTIKETAEIIRDLVNPEVRLKYLPLPHEDPHRRKPDITRAKNMLEWEPRVTFKEGLAETVRYFQKLQG